MKGRIENRKRTGRGGCTSLPDPPKEEQSQGEGTGLPPCSKVVSVKPHETTKTKEENGLK